jgi:putative spermidine/putrescine transport system permease protein
MAIPGFFSMLAFFLFPLAAVLTAGIAEGGTGFRRIFEDGLFLRGLGGSVSLSASTGAASLVAGFFIALRLSTLSERTRSLFLFLLSLPLTFSGMIVAYGFILTFGRAGVVTIALSRFGVDPALFAGFIYSPFGLAFAYCYYLIPRVVLLLLPVLVNFDKSKLAAAGSMGAGRIRVVVDILIPEIMPTALAALCLVAAVAFGAYGTALALMGTQVNILPLLLYSKISDIESDFPSAAALSVILIAVSTSIMACGELAAGRRDGGSR